MPRDIKKSLREEQRKGDVDYSIQLAQTHTIYNMERLIWLHACCLGKCVGKKSVVPMITTDCNVYKGCVCVGGCKYEMCGPRSPFSFFSFLPSFAALPVWLPVFPIVHWSPLCRQEVEEQAAAQLYRSTTWYTKQL